MNRYMKTQTYTEGYGDDAPRTRNIPNVAKIITDIVLVLLALVLILNTVYTVKEGHVGIKKRFSEAVAQVNPGLHFKVPFIESVEAIEIRTRKNVEKMLSSTSEQMPVTVEVSVNWTVDKTAALELFRKYGGLEQFEARILDPRFRSATKNIIPKSTAEQLIQDRSTSITGIEADFIEQMIGFPVSIDSLQIENIVLPKKYLVSIETKQTEKNLAEAEEHKLAKQAFTAQQAVNTADAKAQSIDKIAVAEANAIRIKGIAEADAIKAKTIALGNNPLLVDLTEAENWDGKLPSTMMGSGAVPIMDIRK